MILSSTAEYALRAVLYLAERGDNGPVPAAEVSAALKIPPNYLGKILHELARSKILTSARGKRGGFTLAVKPDRLPLLKVVSLFDDFSQERRCLLGRSRCNDQHPCLVHDRWRDVSEQVTNFFRETTVGDLLKQSQA